MMPRCYWKRCKAVGENKVDVHMEFEHPYICNKHFKRLLKILNIKREN